jgi:membrane dipeptidase
MGGAVLERVTGGGLVWDNHSCMPLRPDDYAFLPRLEDCRAAGVDIITLNVGFGVMTIKDHVSMLATFRQWVRQHPETLMLVGSAADVLTAKKEKRLGVCFDIEGMTALEGRIEMVSLYYDLGVRWMLGAYNVANDAAGGCLDAEDRGLTPFGRKVVAEMNRVGMVVCGTHTGYRTAREMIDLSSAPTIFSHSNPRGAWDHPRNIPDDLMTACAARGGVIGLCGIGLFMGLNDIRTDTFVRHIDYTLDLVGEDHVGIALDYVFDIEEMNTYFVTNRAAFPPGLGFDSGIRMIAPAQLAEIGEALARKYSSATIAKIFGGNHLRIAQQVWR